MTEVNKYPKCPKCGCDMVPLSDTVHSGGGYDEIKYYVLPYYKWKCVDCGHTVKDRL